MDIEKSILIRCIRDLAPHISAVDLRRKSFKELTIIYKQLRGY